MLMISQLHASLADPVLDSLNFLNEVVDRFPDAISFAPGAPNPAHLSDIDVGYYIDKYIQYLANKRSLKIDQVRRLLYQYGPARGLINELIATAIQKDRGINVSPEALVITVGAQEAMLLVLRSLFRTSDDKLAVVNPCFVGILGAARLLDIDIISIEETSHGIDLNEFDRACKTAREHNCPIRALYVAPDYSNPAGTILSLEMRYHLLELAERYGVLILEDNAYGFTAPAGEMLPTLKALDTASCVIFLGTFAKICLPGARVGYVVADQLVSDSAGNVHLLADDLATVKSMVSMNTSPICQALIAGMLLEQGGSFSMLEQERSLHYKNNLAFLLDTLQRKIPLHKNLPGISWNHPAGGFFVRMRLPVLANMALLEYAASNYGVLWTPMSPFYLNNNGDNELRLSCSYLTFEQIEEGVERLADFFCSILHKENLNFEMTLNKTHTREKLT